MMTNKNLTPTSDFAIFSASHHFGMDIGGGGELCAARCSEKLEKRVWHNSAPHLISMPKWFLSKTVTKSGRGVRIWLVKVKRCWSQRGVRRVEASCHGVHVTPLFYFLTPHGILVSFFVDFYTKSGMGVRTWLVKVKRCWSQRGVRRVEASCQGFHVTPFSEASCQGVHVTPFFLFVDAPGHPCAIFC